MYVYLDVNKYYKTTKLCYWQWRHTMTKYQLTLHQTEDITQWKPLTCNDDNNCNNDDNDEDDEDDDMVGKEKWLFFFVHTMIF